MSLPININELLTGKTVEWERIEFKEGWNPEPTLRTICAFANDINNWGGGYIIIGIAESKGQPVFPPEGLSPDQVDIIQRELNQYCRKIIPNYFPIVEPIDYQNKTILILWCPGGSIRPYKAPEHFGDNPRLFYYIKRFSSTVHPTRDEERELIAMANQIPFDDRVNHPSVLTDLDLSTIKAFLNEVKSDLENEIPNLTLNEISRRMNIAEGPNEHLLPKNIGLLFFAREPQKFFPSAKIEIVTLNDEAGSNYTEKIFSGTLHRQLKSALEYLKDIVVKEKVVKNEMKAEADRYFNYPYDALEEALCNAVYHRGYDNDSTIEVRIYPSRLDIISFPGPLLPLNKEKLKNNQFDVRKYRNRRIGEFLKELHLTEGRATGIPTIIKALVKNGSPNPVFETDDDRTYFKTTFYTNSYFDIKSLVKEINSKQIDIIRFCVISKSREEIFSYLKVSNQFRNYNKYLVPLIEKSIINRTVPDSYKAPNQKYYNSSLGLEILAYLQNNIE
jgi:ATP-dependent DNA helicase RecG